MLRHGRARIDVKEQWPPLTGDLSNNPTLRAFAHSTDERVNVRASRTTGYSHRSHVLNQGDDPASRRGPIRAVSKNSTQQTLQGKDAGRLQDVDETLPGTAE